MRIWVQLISPANAKHVVRGFGGLYVAVAVGELIFGIAADAPLAEVLIYALLFGGPGAALLYGVSRLPRTRLDPDVYPHVAGWCFGGAGVMLLAVGLLVFNPAVDIDNPIRAVALAAAFGNVGGFGVGLYEARSLTRAREAEAARREAERHKRQLQREKDRLESFAGMLAHELRNPLAIAEMYHPRSTEGDEAAAEQVERAHDRIEEMIDILLVTARGEKATIDRETVAIEDVAASVWETVSPEAADLVVETDRAIRVNPVHFKHLLKNLFDNAVEHGGGDLTVRIGDLDDGFYVEDDGPGIPEGEREAVFEAGHTSKSNGIGLGLTLVGQLVDLYGWNCTVTDAQGGGTRFECTNVDLVPPEERSAN